MDLADFAKRESKFDEARNLFHIVSIIQPYAYQGWLEFSKMEEECGNQKVSRDILIQGLKFNPLNENLFIKAIKVEEKIGNFKEIRQMIKKIIDAPVDKAWRILLEGALLKGGLVIEKQQDLSSTTYSRNARRTAQSISRHPSLKKEKTLSNNQLIFVRKVLNTM